MKRIVLTLWLILISVVLLNSELLLNENFNFDGYLDENGWSQHSGTTDRIDTTIGGLSFPGYVSSGIGNAALMDGTSQDVNRTFTSQSSGSVYVSFLINVHSSGTNYPIHIATSGVGSFKGRLFMIDDSSGDFEFGLSHGSTTVDVQTNNNYSFNTTYLIVLKYEFVTGPSNDEISMFVITTGFPIDEPGIPTLGPEVGTDVSEIGSICLRQSSGIPEIVIDGIRNPGEIEELKKALTLVESHLYIGPHNQKRTMTTGTFTGEQMKTLKLLPKLMQNQFLVTEQQTIHQIIFM